MATFATESPEFSNSRAARARRATATQPKSGYFFDVKNPSNSGYVSGGVPANANVGTRLFTSTEAGIIYADAAGTATAVPNATQGDPIGN